MGGGGGGVLLLRPLLDLTLSYIPKDEQILLCNQFDKSQCIVLVNSENEKFLKGEVQ